MKIKKIGGEARLFHLGRLLLKITQSPQRSWVRRGNLAPTVLDLVDPTRRERRAQG